MKPANKIIIYDDSCPMCSAYTKAFVQTGLIESSGRRSFSGISAELLEQVDNHKCRNEIPLIDTATNKVKYGIEALLEILGDKFPVIKRIGNLKPVNWFLKRFYNLVSFNRRVITASKFTKGNFDCTPDFNVKYRILFLCLGLSFNTIMLIPEYRVILMNSVLNHTSLMQLQAAHFLFVLANISAAFMIGERKALEFLGQANMLALLTTLLLLPLVLINSFIHLPATFNNIYLFALLILIVKEYRRRMIYAEIIPAHKNIVLANILSALSFLLYLSL
jgi:hypothetical protein